MGGKPGKGGKGSGEPFEGWCFNCDVWGHRAADCRKKEGLNSWEEQPADAEPQEEKAPEVQE